MKFKLTLCLLVALFAAACSDDETPADARARVFFDEDSLVTRTWVSATLNDGESSWKFDSEAFFPGAGTDSMVFATPEVKTRASGKLTMTFRIEDSATLICSGSVSVPMSPNWRWSLELIRRVNDPVVSCDDCYGSAQFVMNDPRFTGESVFVLFHGKGLQ
jgi:hypothetical protein